MRQSKVAVDQDAEDLVEISDDLIREILPQLADTVASCKSIVEVEEGEEEVEEMIADDEVQLDAATRFKNLPSAADQVVATIVAAIQTSKALKDCYIIFFKSSFCPQISK